MAITKQTSKRSTGGKAPRAELARRAARKAQSPRAGKRADDDWATHRWIMFTPGSASQWMCQPTDESLEPVSFRDGSRIIPGPVESWCRANPGVALDEERCDRWGLTVESDGEEVCSVDDGQARDTDDDDDDADDDDDDDNDDADADNGGDADDEITPAPKPPAPKPKAPEALGLKTIKYVAKNRQYLGRGDRGQWYPLVFRMITVNDDPAENMKQLRKFDDWCTENPGKPMHLPVGWRSPTTNCSHDVFTDIEIVYRMSGMNCVVLSAANLIARNDPFTAEYVSRCVADFNNLRRFAAWFNHATDWGTLDMFRVMEEVSGTYPSPAAVMDYLLSEKEGVYVVQPIDADGNSQHAIGLNCFNQTIHDSAEKYTMVLSRSSLSLCCGNGYNCVGFLAAYKLYMKPRRKSRKRKSNK